MLRWTSVLAFALLALVGGEATARADAPPAVEAHQTAQPSEIAVEAGAEEAAQPALDAGAVAAASGAAPEGRRTAPSWEACPPTPPPE